MEVQRLAGERLPSQGAFVPDYFEVPKCLIWKLQRKCFVPYTLRSISELFRFANSVTMLLRGLRIVMRNEIPE